MLKEWFWWQIEVSMEDLDDEAGVTLSQRTLFLWMALALQRRVERSLPQQSPGCTRSDNTGEVRKKGRENGNRRA